MPQYGRYLGRCHAAMISRTLLRKTGAIHAFTMGCRKHPTIRRGEPRKLHLSVCSFRYCWIVNLVSCLPANVREIVTISAVLMMVTIISLRFRPTSSKREWRIRHTIYPGRSLRTTSSMSMNARHTTIRQISTPGGDPLKARS